MNGSYIESILTSPGITMSFANSIAFIIAFIPKLVIALIIFFLSKVFGNYLAHVVGKIFESINLKKIIASFQLGVSISDSVSLGLTGLLKFFARYCVIYLGIIAGFQILELNSVAQFLSGIVLFIPRLISALVILFIGIILAGLTETLVKKALFNLDPASARLSGKVSSYTVLGFFVLMSLAEFGLAATFINTLFIGFVAAVALACGLAVGLGAKDLVSDVLRNWYTKRSNQASTKKSK